MFSMKLTLSYVGYLKLDGVRNGETVEVPDGSTAIDVMTRFGIPTHHQRHVTVFVNEEERRGHIELEDGDDLTLVIQVGGG